MPRTAVERLSRELALRELISPVAKPTFGELLDIALVHQRHRLAPVVDGVLVRLADEALRALDGDRLDADRRRLGEADLLHLHLADEEINHLPRFGRLRRPLDAGIDVLGVLAEDHHVDLVRVLHRRRHALEPAHRPQADVEVQLLAQRDVDRTDAAADRRGERPLDRYDELFRRLQCFLRQPDILAVHPARLLAGEHLHPDDPALAAVGLLHSRIDDFQHHRSDVDAGAVALDVGNDRLVRHRERAILVHPDLFAALGDFDMLVGHKGRHYTAATVFKKQ